MAIPTLPGVTIVETEPPSPIRGVSTSIAAFIGLCADGPTGTPTFVGSLDAFTKTFGGPVDGAGTPFYLPLAVEGFFRNGGTQCFVLRAGKATPAFADLPGRATNGVPVGRAVALVTGEAGRGGSVGIKDSSVLQAALGTGQTGLGLLKNTTPVTSVDATRRKLTVGAVGTFAPGDNVVVANAADSDSVAAVISRVKMPNVIELAAALPETPDFAGGTVTTAPPKPGDKKLRLDVPATLSLRVVIPRGSVVVLDDGTAKEWAVVAETTGEGVVLDKPLTRDLKPEARLSTAEFDMTVAASDGAGPVTYRGLSTTPSHPRWWAGPTVDSGYLRIVPAEAGAPAGQDPRPKAGLVTLGAGQADDPLVTWKELDSDHLRGQLALLEAIDEISLVVVPGIVTAEAQQAVVEHCETLHDRFAILDTAQGIEPQTAVQQRATLTGKLDKGFAALYYPWIQIRDPARNRVVPQPPSGHIAGIYAATDKLRGVHKAPANSGIAGALGLDRRLRDSEQELLNPNGVNALRILPGQGVPVVWGARTTSGDVTWQYINVRRLFLFLEESIQASLRGAVFEPNDLALWNRLKRTLTEFLGRVWRDGALFGATEEEAFFVRIDDVLNPPATRKQGVLNVEIGVQPVYPAEFVVVRIGIWDGGSQVSE
ncbi:phage tail sheath subtilisin-like domain-containing protein [Streptomyces sp. NPDC000410]|uniref:phage tail sheath subtilisin-like domain-containing protein n=1 Tax=Streptomyces sp. NPDC000410 TaxID=3154254 RepID=UPI00331A5809